MVQVVNKQNKQKTLIFLSRPYSIILNGFNKGNKGGK